MEEAPPDLRTFVQGLALTWEDVGLCLENGRRLMRDARFRTLESRLALRELALEEFAKGSMITIRIFLQEAAMKAPPGPQPWPDPTNEAAAILSKHWRLLSDGALRKAFYDHDIKLEHVDMFLESAREAIVSSPVNTAGLPVTMKIAALFSRSPGMRKFADRHFFEAVQVLRRTGIVRLDELNKAATFVGLDRARGRCFPPVADYEVMSAIWTIDHGMMNFLRTSLHWAGARRRWSLTSDLRA